MKLAFISKYFMLSPYPLASESHITKVHMVEKPTNYVVTPILYQKSLIIQGKDNYDDTYNAAFSLKYVSGA